MNKTLLSVNGIQNDHPISLPIKTQELNRALLYLTCIYNLMQVTGNSFSDRYSDPTASHPYVMELQAKLQVYVYY